MAISPTTPWCQGGRKIGKFEVLFCRETVNYIQFMAQRAQKYASRKKASNKSS